MNVLGRMIEAVEPGGLILDLQVIRPNPKVELNGCVVAEIDGEPLFRWADAATAAIDARIEAGDLVEEAVDDHEVCKHYRDGGELVEDVAGSKRRFPEEVVPRVAAIGEHVVTRELCRLRRLRVRGHASDAASGAASAVHDRGHRWVWPRSLTSTGSSARSPGEPASCTVHGWWVRRQAVRGSRRPVWIRPWA